MSSPTAPAPTSGTDARPVDLSERVTLLDVLRGFALCGVFVSNSVTWFSGRVLLPREQAQALSAPVLETVVTALYNFFVNQKFVTLFSFLFGLGFSIQLSRAEARGASIVPLYSRRLLVLLGRSGRVAMALAHLRPRAAHAPGARGSHGTRGGLTPLHERGAAGRCPVQGP